MNKELLKLKKQIKKMATPSKEEQISKSLQTIFHDMEVGLTDEEAFKILGWDYKSKSELFGTLEN